MVEKILLEFKLSYRLTFNLGKTMKTAPWNAVRKSKHGQEWWVALRARTCSVIKRLAKLQAKDTTKQSSIQG